MPSKDPHELPDLRLLTEEIAVEKLAKEITDLRKAALFLKSELDRVRLDRDKLRHRARRAEGREELLDNQIECLSLEDERWLMTHNLRIHCKRSGMRATGRIEVRTQQGGILGVARYDNAPKPKTSYLKEAVKKARERRGT